MSILEAPCGSAPSDLDDLFVLVVAGWGGGVWRRPLRQLIRRAETATSIGVGLLLHDRRKRLARHLCDVNLEAVQALPMAAGEIQDILRELGQLLHVTLELSRIDGRWLLKPIGASRLPRGHGGQRRSAWLRLVCTRNVVEPRTDLHDIELDEHEQCLLFLCLQQVQLLNELLVPHVARTIGVQHCIHHIEVALFDVHDPHQVRKLLRLLVAFLQFVQRQAAAVVLVQFAAQGKKFRAGFLALMLLFRCHLPCCCGAGFARALDDDTHEQVERRQCQGDHD
mmetsp:Transcript_49213/g.136729  ORF Transcript_49213/g.136729 Transcript_49213/m.136729 type:complete len:281 (-) Transcript_49213:654-1496(-)